MKRLLTLLGISLCMAGGYAQGIQHRQMQESFDEFRRSLHEDFESFRQQCMNEFLEFVRNPWKEFEKEKPVLRPKDEEVPPVVMPEEDKGKPIKDTPVVIEEVVEPPVVEPQPQPVEPIEEVPVVEEKTVDVNFYGLTITVRFDTSNRVHLVDCRNDHVADALRLMSSETHDNLILDCLIAREVYDLSDWAYLQLLEKVAKTICPDSQNDASLLMSYLYLMSGYQMRFATDGTRLYMLYASRHQIYEQGAFTLNGVLYYGVEHLPSSLSVCSAAFEGEQALSLWVTQQQHLGDETATRRTITSSSYPEMSFEVNVNKNLIAFYNSYPSSMIDDNFLTRWAMYATPQLEESLRTQLYPQMKKVLEGLTPLEAANKLLNWVQTGFVYQYDDKVWGHDRAFFSEETLYYPFCDCEDRSILFSRLVRDLLHLPVLLVYYPGHLATAVGFKTQVAGDWIEVGGTKYVICDPTYIGAPVGMTMSDMNNKTAKVILLE